MSKYFQEREYSCKCGCGKSDISDKLLFMLDELREKCNMPLIINSGVRCENHNSKTNGSPTSSHVLGFAVDIKAVSSQDKFKIVKHAIDIGFKRIGVYSSFIHLDIDENKPQYLIFYGGY